MSDKYRLSQEINSVSAGVLFSDLDVAQTFMDVAETTREPETVLRNYQNALKAYRFVKEFRPRLALTEEQERMLDQKLSTLEARLAAAGLDVA